MPKKVSTYQLASRHLLRQSRDSLSKDWARLPHNRRNIYGAALAYGPVLVSTPRLQPMFQAVTRYALCDRAPLLRELGLDPATITPPVRLHDTPLPGTRMDAFPSMIEVPCS